jgi:hypothetical protein
VSVESGTSSRRGGLGHFFSAYSGPKFITKLWWEVEKI